MQYLLYYLLLINAAGVLLMLIDKEKAKRNRFRIPEATLLGVAVLGGSVGVLVGMYAFRHKTRHVKFKIGVPLILLAQIIIAATGGIIPSA